jgi:hypothetical protein
MPKQQKKLDKKKMATIAIETLKAEIYETPMKDWPIMINVIMDAAKISQWEAEVFFNHLVDELRVDIQQGTQETSIGNRLAEIDNLAETGEEELHGIDKNLLPYLTMAKP